MGRNKISSLKYGRPPMVVKKPVMSARSTRTIIRAHHQLEKALAVAQSAGDAAEVSRLEQQLAAQGGLAKYQQASLQGQGRDRGSDSSKQLLEWLRPSLTDQAINLRVLEVGALSTQNECSRSPFLSVTRIDLHSQEPGIEQQDFMQRPLPRQDCDYFDIVSLSLVLNYVPTSDGRGAMLRRICNFFARPVNGKPLPLLFLVLPAPCVLNSRYLDDAQLEKIMRSLGFGRLQCKSTAKLIYYLWEYTSTAPESSIIFPKVEVNAGSRRNNFCITLA